jgi:imidazole glycerol-phosphate synthase subunit HisH
MPGNSKKIVIIDYGMGNLRSVYNKFRRMGYVSEISSDPYVIKKANTLILPGVGHFAKGMKNLEEKGLVDVLNDKVINEKIPIFGICLGMQLFSEYSEEGNCKGLGWLKAKTVRFKINDKIKYKIPHIGWNTVNIINKSGIDDFLADDDFFYFVHTYHIQCSEDADVWMTSRYESDFISAVKKSNIYGTQFHPEKSHDAGFKLLKNFIEL